MKRYKNKIICCFSIIVICFAIGLIIKSQIYCTKTPYYRTVFLSNSEIEEELDETVDKQLNDLDLSDIEDIFNSLSKDDKSFFSNKSFIQIVKNFISMDNASIYNNFLPYLLNILFRDILKYLPYIIIVIAISITYSLVVDFSNDKSKSIITLITIVSFATIAVIILKIIFTLFNSSLNSINLIARQMEAVFPVLLTLITAIGETTTATTFQPILLVLSNGISKFFIVFLLPVFIFSIVFAVIGNLSKNVKLENFSNFFKSLFSWSVGIVFTIFIAFLTLHGLTVSTIDSISLRTAKFAIKNYIPLLGSYLSDGISLILASSVLIKNAIGISGLFLLFSSICSPILSIIVVSLLLKLVSAILQPICDNQITTFISIVAKNLSMLVTCLLAIGFMYIISVAILMSCSNIL